MMRGERAPLPAGLRQCDLKDPFEALVGPLYENEGEGTRRHSAFYVDERHVTPDGRVHEGMMMTFADAFLGSVAHRAADHRTCVTLSMEANFLAWPQLGDLVEQVGDVDRVTRSVIFASATFRVGDEAVMRASSLWKIIGA